MYVFLVGTRTFVSLHGMKIEKIKKKWFELTDIYKIFKNTCLFLRKMHMFNHLHRPSSVNSQLILKIVIYSERTLKTL